MTDVKVPRYRAIADELTSAIVRRQYPIGATLPPEVELCRLHEASRHTIREALRIVEEAGLIRRRQGSGSEVIADTPPVRYRHVVDRIEDLLQFGGRTRLELLQTGEVQADERLAQRLGLRLRTPCVALRVLRREHDGQRRPVALSEVYVPPQPARRRQRLLDSSTALKAGLSLIDPRTIGRIDQVFDAVSLDAESAALLGTRRGAPSLRVARSYHDRDERPVVAATTWHRGDLYRYTAVLRHEALDDL